MPEEIKKEEEIGEEIDAMLNALSGEAPRAEEEKKEEKAEHKEEEKKEEEEEEKLPEKKEDEKEEEKSEPDEKDRTITELREKLAAKEAAEKVKKVEEKEESEPDLTPEAQDFIGDLDLDDLTRDKEILNKILNTVYTKGLNDSRKVVGEGILRGIPDIVKKNIEVMNLLKETSEKFYKDNADLSPFKKVVAAVFEEVAAANPDKKYSELLAEVGTETRKRLDLHKKAVEKESGKKEGSPRLPQKKGTREGIHEKPNTSPLQDEIAEMNKSIGR